MCTDNFVQLSDGFYCIGSKNEDAHNIITLNILSRLFPFSEFGPRMYFL